MRSIVIYLLKVLKYTKFKAKDSEKNAALLSLGNVSNDSSADNRRKTALRGYVYDLSVDYDSIDIAGVLNIYKNFMKKSDIK